ncbi:MAG: O-antigen ligase family protein, partial [Chloroflexota bacterium]
IAILPLTYSLAILGGIAFFLLVLVQPLFGLALVLVAGPAGAFENIVFGNRVPESGQLLLLVTLTAWIGHGVIRRRLIIHKTPLNLPLALFVGIGLVSLLTAESLSYGFKEVLKWLEIWLVMQMVYDLSTQRYEAENGEEVFDERRHVRFDARWLMAMLLMAGLSQAFIGIWQFALRGVGPDHFMILDRFYRAFGTFQQPNPYGGYMSLVACLAIGATIGMVMILLRNVRRRQFGKPAEWFWLLFFGACALFTSMGLVMSWSRGAWLGFAAGMAVLLVFVPRKRFIGLLLLALSILLLLVGLRFNLIPSSLSQRLVGFSEDLQVGDVRGVHITTENYAVIERLAHWQAGADMARENLLLGVGFGNYEPAYEDYATLNWPHPLGHAHNYYLNILAESGIIGAIIYWSLWVVIFVQVIRLIGRIDWPHRGLALGLLAAWMALSVHHFFDKLYVNNLFIFLGAMLGTQQVLTAVDD